MRPKIFVGIPVHTGEVMVSTVISLISLMRECRAINWPDPTIYFRVGDSDLIRARNAVFGHFLKSDCTDLMLIDADISWPPWTIRRMVECGVEYLAAAYRGRVDYKETYFILWPDQKEMITDPITQGPLLKVDAISMGFCRLKRSCVEKLAESTNGQYLLDPQLPDEHVPWIVDFEHKDGNRYEEGYSLARRWRSLGGECWLDPTIRLGHMGPKVFEGDLIGYLADMQANIVNEKLAGDYGFRAPMVAVTEPVMVSTDGNG